MVCITWCQPNCAFSATSEEKWRPLSSWQPCQGSRRSRPSATCCRWMNSASSWTAGGTRTSPWRSLTLWNGKYCMHPSSDCIGPTLFCGLKQVCGVQSPPLQICSSGWCCAPLPPWPHTPGSPTICCGETGSKLYYLCYNSCLQDGSDVHVWFISGKERVREISCMQSYLLIQLKCMIAIAFLIISFFPPSLETTVKISHCSPLTMWTVLLIKSSSWNTLRLSIWKVS